MKKVGIVMGSDSDLPVVQKAIDTLKEYGVPFEVHVFSAHRTPDAAGEFAANARKNGFGAEAYGKVLDSVRFNRPYQNGLDTKQSYNTHTRG